MTQQKGHTHNVPNKPWKKDQCPYFSTETKGRVVLMQGEMLLLNILESVQTCLAHYDNVVAQIRLWWATTFCIINGKPCTTYSNIRLFSAIKHHHHQPQRSSKCLGSSFTTTWCQITTDVQMYCPWYGCRAVAVHRTCKTMLRWWN